MRLRLLPSARARQQPERRAGIDDHGRPVLVRSGTRRSVNRDSVALLLLPGAPASCSGSERAVLEAAASLVTRCCFSLTRRSTGGPGNRWPQLRRRCRWPTSLSRQGLRFEPCDKTATVATSGRPRRPLAHVPLPCCCRRRRRTGPARDSRAALSAYLGDTSNGLPRRAGRCRPRSTGGGERGPRHCRHPGPQRSPWRRRPAVTPWCTGSGAAVGPAAGE